MTRFTDEERQVIADFLDIPVEKVKLVEDFLVAKDGGVFVGARIDGGDDRG